MDRLKPSIEKIPVKFQDERGQFIEILKGIPGLQLNMLITKKGAVRGNHYHHKKEEHFYVLEGIVNFVFGTEKGEATSSHECGPGTLIGIPPGLPHVFIGLSHDSILIEYQNVEYDADNPDVVPVNLL